MSAAARHALIGCAAVCATLFTAALGWAAPGAAGQQGGGSSEGSTASAVSILLGQGARILAEHDVSLAVRGDVSIQFHGDKRTGCAAHGLCGYRGRIVIHSGPQGTITLVKYRRHDRTSYAAGLFLEPTFTGTGVGSHTARFVNGSEAGLCADASLASIESSVDSRTGRLTLPLLQAGGEVLSTRCPGPLDGDVASAAPRAKVTVRGLMHPGREIDLSGTHSFADHGFAGTVSSTVVLQVRSVHRESSGPGTTKGKTTRVRFVNEKLALVGMSGQLTATVQGTTDRDVCVLLDSCGLAGTLSWSPAPVQATGELSAEGLASRPHRDFLAALGLSRIGNPRGITVSGDIEWRDQGLLSESVTQSAICTDTARLRFGAALFEVVKSRLEVIYLPLSPLRTRCPGPILGGANGLAEGGVSRSTLARRRFAIRLMPSGAVHDDGYQARLSGRLKLVVKPSRRTTQQVMTLPAGAVGSFSG